ncbi:hypothetical protein [Xanthomonas hortorum]|uniref:hypothetical protein n=1 Tax=Xanthomonas hortorum TaxID=56454 RepID=UPI00293607FD|nr:hypothetical protein [Xanthomonas hortorum]MDV2453409.1 hypothetical protein [Xanthomonas hortorum NBC5720]
MAVAGQKLLKAFLPLDKDPVASHRFQAVLQASMLNRIANAGLGKMCIDTLSDHHANPLDLSQAVDTTIEHPRLLGQARGLHAPGC